MAKPHNIASFVLRFTQELWQDTGGEPHVRWRGHIRHVQGTAEERFTDFADAVTFMQRYLTQLTIDTLSGTEELTQEKIFAESFKMWEQFASSYAKMMSQAMEQSVRQSETFREQIDEAGKRVMDAWRIPFQADQHTLAETVDHLQAQIEALAKKVETLEQQLRSQK